MKKQTVDQSCPMPLITLLSRGQLYPLLKECRRNLLSTESSQYYFLWALKHSPVVEEVLVQVEGAHVSKMSSHLNARWEWRAGKPKAESYQLVNPCPLCLCLIICAKYCECLVSFVYLCRFHNIGGANILDIFPQCWNARWQKTLLN